MAPKYREIAGDSPISATTDPLVAIAVLEGEPQDYPDFVNDFYNKDWASAEKRLATFLGVEEAKDQIDTQRGKTQSKIDALLMANQEERGIQALKEWEEIIPTLKNLATLIPHLCPEEEYDTDLAKDISNLIALHTAILANPKPFFIREFNHFSLTVVSTLTGVHSSLEMDMFELKDDREKEVILDPIEQFIAAQHKFIAVLSNQA